MLAWSDTKGLMAQASVGVGGISWDEEANQQFYNQQVNAKQVLAGDVKNPHEDVLQSEFAQFSGQSSMQPMQDQTPMNREEQHQYGHR